MLAHQMNGILHRAQNTYGYANQVTVASEELAELICVLSKYPRFPDHDSASDKLREKIVEEIGDVVICLHHLYMMFNIADVEIEATMEKKLLRLARWLDKSDDQLITTTDREVGVVTQE